MPLVTAWDIAAISLVVLTCIFFLCFLHDTIKHEIDKSREMKRQRDWERKTIERRR